MLLEPAGWSLDQSSDHVLGRLSDELSPHTFPETHAAVVELATGIHPDVDGVLAELTSLRNRLSCELDRMGLAVAAARTHPLTVREETEVSGAAHYRDLGDSLRVLARRELSAGRVLPACPRARVRRRARAWVPRLAAANAADRERKFVALNPRVDELVASLADRLLAPHRRCLSRARRPSTPIRSDRKERHMCRWLAYSGAPILLKDVLYGGTHSLVDQSLHSRLGAETTNGDGFGVGWYGEPATPGVFHSIEPAWNDRNLRELAGHISSPLFFTHIRAAIGSAVQQTNCHPFRHDHWLFMHNGYINEFAAIKRELILAVDPSLYPQIQGQADTEVLFYLALTLGLEDDPPAAVEQAIGLVEAVASRHDVPHPFQGTIATTDGESIWAFRYSSEHNSRSLFYTTDVPTLRKRYPDREELREFSDDARLIVSEPLGDVAGVWNEVPESTWVVVSPDREELQPFRPKAPSTSVPVA